MADLLRPPTPAGGWGRPWPDVAELAAAVPASAWTLIGGLMVQLHALVAGLPVVRPTDDVDVLLHVETGQGRAAQVAGALGDSWATSCRRASTRALVPRTASSAAARWSTW